MLFCFVLAVLCFYSGQANDEFANFKRQLKAVQDRRVRPILEAIRRQADPCRVKTLTGSGRLGTLPNSAQKALTKLEDAASDIGKKAIRKPNKAIGLTACKEALMGSTDKRVNVKICGKALAHYRAKLKDYSDGVGRNVGSAWDMLYGELSEYMTTEEILEALDIWDVASLGLLIDNTGSMSDDIDQVTKVAEKFVETDPYREVINNFVIMTFGDPDYQEPTSYLDPARAVNHLDNNIVASMGGDCPEMTCQALEQMITYSYLYEDSPVFVFTDASSKDCNEHIVTDLEEFAQSYSETFNFVLTGTCDPNGTIDGNFTRLASSTGGSIYRISDDEIYKLTDIIADSTESSSYVAYDEGDWDEGDWDEDDWDEDDWDEDDWEWRRKKRDTAASDVDHMLQRKKRQSGYSSLSFYVDETVGRLTMQVTFEKFTDRRVLDGVTMTPISRCGEGEGSGRRFGNTVHHAVDCPCLGEWQVKIPYSVSNKWTFSAKTFGQYTIAFDIEFEQSSSSGMIEISKEPCAGDTAIVWVTFLQGESVDEKNITSIILRGEEGYEQLYRLTKPKPGTRKWKTIMIVPEVAFSVAVRGTTVGGNTFLRLLNTQIKPAITCLSTERIYPSQQTMKAGGESLIIMSLKNKYKANNYRLYCFNNKRGAGFQTQITRPRGRLHQVTELDRHYYIYVKVTAPADVKVGEVVQVKCYARSDDSVSKTVNLMVSSVYV